MLYNFDAARNEHQLAKMQDLEAKGVCIFCPEHIHEDEEELIIDSTHWMVKKNTYPYKGSKLHLVIIPKLHVSTVAELPIEAQQAFLPTIVECETLFKLGSFAIGMRSGDMRYNGGSIDHLHAHLLVGGIDSSDSEIIRFKMSSRPKHG